MLMSEKLDGMRAVWDGEGLYSRTGKPVSAPPSFFEQLPPGFALDGELFLGRKRFQVLQHANS
jgi:DNA ligase-1